MIGAFTGSRYTRKVSWKQRVTRIVLVVLAALPVASTLCALECDSPAKATASHHASGAACEETAPSSDGPQISSPASHDCTSHQSVRDVATTVGPRTALSLPLIQLPSSAVHATQSLIASRALGTDYTSPPGTTPPTTIPVVLRV